MENAQRFPRASTGPFPSNHPRKTPKGPKIALGNPDRPQNPTSIIFGDLFRFTFLLDCSTIDCSSGKGSAKMNRMVPKLPDSVELVELRVGDPAALTRLSEQRLPSRSFKIVAAASVELCCQNPLDEGHAEDATRQILSVCEAVPGFF